MQTYHHKGMTLTIEQDQSPQSPREWGNIGTMACFHNRYNLGDKHDFADPEELTAYIKKNKAIALPLYLYDHGGITMKTSPFSCPWDSGQVGYIFVLPEKIKAGKITKKQALAYMEGEVKIYDQYLTGDVYGFTITKQNTCKTCKHAEDEHVDSCWGFYGSDPLTNGMVDHIGEEWTKIIKKQTK